MPITLATLDTATAQEVFNQVATHLLQQNQVSQGIVNGRTSCLYRYTKDDGTVLKCAAGCLMSDDEATEISLAASWSTLVYESRVAVTHSGLIAELQWIHDSNEPNTWVNLLTKFATNHNLTTEVLDT